MNLRQQTLDAAGGNITRLSAAIERSKATDAARLHNEYQRLVSGMQAQGAIPDDNWLANPVLPDDILREAVCAHPIAGSRFTLTDATERAAHLFYAVTSSSRQAAVSAPAMTKRDLCSQAQS